MDTDIKTGEEIWADCDDNIPAITKRESDIINKKWVSLDWIIKEIKEKKEDIDWTVKQNNPRAVLDWVLSLLE